MITFERIKNFRNDSENHPSWVVKGPKGAVEFHYWKPKEEDSFRDWVPAGIEYHSKKPMYENQTSLQDFYRKKAKEKGIIYKEEDGICKLTDGECYCDGTSLGGERFYEIYVEGIRNWDEKCDEHIFIALERYYRSKFEGSNED